ncbi:MAG: prepilin-type N-terminal cleavage/methylation domain-containing protein [Candidatus Levybacteria bacterium]|nr:prepilin-type N-terminal cleavage/methylation domain-containing protein [Candidatus Levybacteria bacterium]
MKKFLTSYILHLTFREGYTIIELLAVISILVILTGIISGILYSTLHGSSKTKITSEVTQNGNYAISILTNIMSSSTSVTKIGGVEIQDCTANPTGTSISLKNINGDEYNISCSGNNISSGSTSLINTDQVQIRANSCQFYCNQKAADPYAVPILGIEFIIEDKSAELFENRSSSLFKTSVSMRNYSP